MTCSITKSCSCSCSCCVMFIQSSSQIVFGSIRIPIHCSDHQPLRVFHWQSNGYSNEYTYLDTPSPKWNDCKSMNIILRIEGLGGSIVTVNYSYEKRVTLLNLPDRYFIHFSFVQQQIYCIPGQFGILNL